MNRVATSLAAMMIIAGMLYRPSSQHRLSPSLIQPPNSSMTQAAGEKTDRGSKGCAENDGPWTAVQNSLEAGASKDNDQGLFAAAWDKPKSTDETRALIATVADPAHTRLALYFDRSVDVIVQAASASGYQLDRWWLPWSDRALQDEPDCSWRVLAKLERDRKEKEPGLLIFRLRPGQEQQQLTPYLLVFLVGESPIYGISKAQFADAVGHILAAWGNPLCTKSQSCSIGVLGPSFSGSADSLADAIRAVKSKAGKGKQPPTFRVSSGWITDRAAVDTLRQVFGCAADQDSRDCRFGTTLADDETAFNEFIAYLDSQHIHQNVALITESETSYGVSIFENLEHSLIKLRNQLWMQFLPKVSQDLRTQLPKNFEEQLKSNASPQLSNDLTAALRQQSLTRLLSIKPKAQYEFPRQISRLREAYEMNPSTGVSGEDASNPLPRRLLPLDLKDTPLLTEDVPPSFSKLQTPLSEELEMVGLTTELERDEIQYVGIVATDPLDTLFLIRLLQRTDPNIQLYTLDSDLLFLRAQDEEPPEGLLAVTSYPLFLRNRDWQKKSHRLFPSRSTEAMYNACLLLLDEPDEVLDSSKPVPLGDDSVLNAPLQGVAGFNPPLWLTTVGREGYFPVSVLDEDLPNYRGSGSEPLTRIWILLWGLVIGFATLHVAAFVIARFSNRLGLEAFRLADKRPSYILSQAFHLLVTTVSLGLVEVVLVFPARRVYRLTVWPAALSYVVGAALAITTIYFAFTMVKYGVAALQSLKPARPVRVWVGRVWGVRNDLGCFALAFGTLWGAEWFCAWWWKATTAADYYSVFFDYRCVQLASGVSPALPFLLLFMAVYLWSWMHLLRLAQTLRRPRVIVNVDNSFGCFEGKTVAAFVELIYDWRLQAALAGLFFCGFWLAKPDRTVISFETSAFSNWYLGLLVVLSWLLFSSLARFGFVWSQLKNILRRLEQLPFREAFNRLPKQFSWSPIWQQGGTRRSYKIMARSVDCLTKLVATLPVTDPSRQTLDARLTEIRDRVRVITTHEAAQTCPSEGELDDAQTSLRDTGDWIVTNCLKAMWASGSSDSASKEENENLTQKAREARFRADLTRILAEEFLALRYVAYIRSTCIEMRYLLFFVSASFILSLISVKSYAFQAHHAMGWLMTAIFIVLGGAIIKVFADMERDSILSRVAATQPGRLGVDFFVRIFSFGALPLFTVIAAQFPSVARFFFSWIQPGLQALK